MRALSQNYFQMRDDEERARIHALRALLQEILSPLCSSHAATSIIIIPPLLPGDHDDAVTLRASICIPCSQKQRGHRRIEISLERLAVVSNASGCISSDGFTLTWFSKVY